MQVKFSNKLVDKIICNNKKQTENSEIFGKSKNLKSFFHKELDLYQDKVVLEEIIKKKDQKGKQIK